MRASRALAAAAAACAAVGLYAPTAVAGGDGGDRDSVHVSVSPHAVHQGGTLTITVRGCDRGGTIASNAFPRIHLHRGEGRGNDRDGGNQNNQNNRDNQENREDGRGGGADNDRTENRADDRGEDRDGRGNSLSVGARIHDHASPGHYNLVVRCQNSSQVETAQFTVLSGRGARGGLGGSLGPSSAETAVGVGMVAAAAVGGALFVVRRRRTVGGRI
ncbi:hypothetical protein [Streptomyces sp. NPDC014894]|uniref:hypothetical protein n=1 Tax=Streptomyces sp. NPDC014894 TaxID=3364931 RepID=UPI0036F4D1A7